MAQRWWDYVQRISGGASQAEIARRLGIGQTSVSRWQHGYPRPENVRAFAKEYGRPVAEAMIAAGYLEPEDLRAGSAPAERTIEDRLQALLDSLHPDDRPVVEGFFDRLIRARQAVRDDEAHGHRRRGRAAG